MCETGIHSSVGASLAVFRGVLHAAGKGVEGDEGIWHATFDGSTWARPKPVPSPATTSARPSLTVWSDGPEQKLVMAWKGGSDEHTIWYSTFDGSCWSPQQPIPNATSNDGPALVFFQGAIYAAWRGSGDDERMWYASYNGTSWTNPELLPNPFAHGSLGPALVVFHDQLYAAWKGREGDGRVLWTRTATVSKATDASTVGERGDIGGEPVSTPIGSGNDGGRVRRSSSSDEDDSGLSDIKRGVQKGMKKGKSQLSDAWSKFKHK